MATSVSVSDHLTWALLFMLLPLCVISQRINTISMGSSLSTNEKSSWVSPSGEFAFGFQAIKAEGSSSNKLYVVGVWFEQIQEKTMVWTAKTDEPAEEGSTVGLVDGELVLRSPQGNQIWKANANGTVTSAAILDTGNFVLVDSASAPRWESFAFPTDTILPTQTLGLSSKLSCKASPTNYSTGKFRLSLQLDGNLILHTVAIPSENPYGAYWKSNTEGNATQLVFNETGYIYLALQNGGSFNVTKGIMAFPRDFYQRATLDYDGVFRQYTHPKNNSSGGGWAATWSPADSLPRDICMANAVDVGGVCGFNSYCKLEGNEPSCLCPTGYGYVDMNDKFKGCKQDFISENCANNSSGEASLFDIDEVVNTDWPLSDYEHYKPMDENQCREACLGDCFCAVAIFREENCWKKKLPLSNGRMNSRIGGKALIKVRKKNSTLPSGAPGLTNIVKKDQGALVLILYIIVGSSGFLNFLLSAILLTICYFYHSRVVKFHSSSRLFERNMRSFTYKELEEITNGFKEELGRGSCGTVYRGLDSDNHVAVKKLERVLDEAKKELTNEVKAIGRIHHKNLVQLLGYCEEGPNLLLVYEFMANGSLATFLFGNPRPSWNQRTKVAFGIARGLTYVHEDCSTQIIHCDIKPQNILLDNSFAPKISDFGLAKVLKTNQTRTTTCIRGTKGYVAPEWFKNMPITAKVDVYSFGVLLLEIVSCRKPYEPDLENAGNHILIDWVCDCYKDNRLDLLVEGDEEALHDIKRLERMIMVGIWCLQEDPSLRPTMKKVTQMLEGAVDVALPPEPYSFISALD